MTEERDRRGLTEEDQAQLAEIYEEISKLEFIRLKKIIEGLNTGIEALDLRIEENARTIERSKLTIQHLKMQTEELKGTMAGIRSAVHLNALESEEVEEEEKEVYVWGGEVLCKKCSKALEGFDPCVCKSVEEEPLK